MDKENEEVKAKSDEKEVKETAETSAKKKTTSKAKKEAPKEEKNVEEVKEEKLYEETSKEEKEKQAKEEVKEEAKPEENKEQPKTENITSKKSSSSNKALIMIGIIAVLVIAIVALVFYFVKNMSASADKVFKNILNKYEDYVVSNLDIGDVKSIKSNMNLDLELKVNGANEGQEIIDIINNLKLNMNMEMDLDKNNMAYNLTANIGEDELINVDAYLVENDMYAKLNGILDKYIKLDMEETSGINIDYGALYDSEAVIVKSFIGAINDSLKEEYFTQDKTEDGTKNTLILNNSNTKAILKDVMTTLKSDKKFITEMAKLYESSEEELVSSIDDILEEIDSEEIFSNGQSIEISIFTKKLSNKITRVNISFIEDKDVVSNIAFKVISNEEISYEISSNDEKIAGSIIIKNTSKTDAEMIITLNYEDNLELTAKLDYSYLENKSNNIALPDFSGSIKLEEMTNKDAQQVLTNIQNNKALLNIVEKFSNFLPDDDDYYDDDEDDDYYDDEDDEEMTTETNELKSGRYIINFEIPRGYTLDREYSTDKYKYFELEDVEDDEEIEVYINISERTAEEYFESVEKYKYDYKVNDDTNFYKNVKMSEIKEEKFGDNVVKYVTLTYDAGSSLKYDTIYAAYEIDEDCSYIIEIEALDTKIPSSVFKKFATFTLKK